MIQKEKRKTQTIFIHSISLRRHGWLLQSPQKKSKIACLSCVPGATFWATHTWARSPVALIHLAQSKDGLDWLVLEMNHLLSEEELHKQLISS